MKGEAIGDEYMTESITVKFRDINISELTKNQPSNITIYDSSGHILINELSLLAIIKGLEPSGILALGNEAKLVSERLQNSNNILVEHKIGASDIAIGSPLRDGVIADIRGSYNIFRYLLQSIKAIHPFGLIRPSVAVCTLSKMTSVEHDIMVSTLVQSGCKDIIIFNKSFQDAQYDIPNKYKFIIEISECQICECQGDK